MMVSLLVKATAIALIGLGAAHAARRCRASVRHAILAATFAVLLALPIATLLLPAIALVVPATDAALAPWPPPVASAARTVQGAVFGTAEPVQGVPRANAWTLTAILAATWATGAVALLFSLATGLWRLYHLRRNGLPWIEARGLVATLADAGGVTRRVDVLLHEDLAAPVTCGLLRPAIVLPVDAREWSDPPLRRALVHELEHVRRRDWWTHLAARATCAAYWFHPLVWIAWRQLALAAEHACDDAVIEREESTQYADQLVMLARRMSTQPSHPALAMANRSELSARVRALLDATQARGRTGLLRAAIIAVAAAVVVAAIAPLHLVAAPASAAAPSAVGAEQARRGRTARLDRILLEAAAEGDVTDIGELLDDGADINAAVAGDGSPLIAAARAGRLAAVQLLLDRGADPNMGVSGDGNALIMAAREGHLPVVQLLLDRGADVEAMVEGDENALIQASASGELDVVKLLVARGADVNARYLAPTLNGEEWRSPLSVAARGRHGDVVAFLRSAGAVQN